MATNYGDKAIQVVEFVEGKSGKREPRIHIDRIMHIIHESKIGELPLEIVSIAGVARSGKSFFLNLLLHKHQHDIEHKTIRTAWIDSQKAVTGINWARSEEGVTMGMWMWNSALLVKNNDGKEKAVLLIDSQGTSDILKSPEECMDIIIMYISLEISTVQIININQLHRSEDLKMFQVCKAYSRMLGSNEGDNKEVPMYLYQSLVLLFRNWNASDDPGHLNGMFENQIHRAKDAEAKVTLEGIKNTFENIDCFALPYPGKAVDRAKDSDIGLKIADIDDQFVVNAEELLKNILQQEGFMKGHMVSKYTWRSYEEKLKQLKYRFEGGVLPNVASAADHLYEKIVHSIYTEALDNWKDLPEKTDEAYNLDDLGKSLRDTADNISNSFRSRVEKKKLENSVVYKTAEEQLNKDLEHRIKQSMETAEAFNNKRERQQKLKEMKEQVAKINAERDRISEELKQVCAATEQFNTLSNKIATISKGIEDESSSIKELKKVEDAAIHVMKEYERKIAELNTAIEKRDEQSEKDRQEIGSLNEKLDQKKKENSDSNANILKAENNVKQKEEELAHLQSSMSAMKQAMTEETRNVDMIEQLKRSLAEKDHEDGRLKLQMTDLSNKMLSPPTKPVEIGPCAMQ